MTTPRPDKEDLWRWAAGIMHGDGISTRAKYRIVPTVHLLAWAPDGLAIWCGGSPALAENTIRPKYCPKCLALAGEMWDELAEEAE